MISLGVSHSDGSCVSGRIPIVVLSNIPKKVYHIVTSINNTYLKHDFIVPYVEERSFIPLPL